MRNTLFYPIGSTAACSFAAAYLNKCGILLTDHPSPEVTHLLLDVPSFAPDGTLRGGGDLKSILRMLPAGITVAGGNLASPVLEGYQTLDLLKDEGYLAKNAAITAECALQTAAQHMEQTFADSTVLVVGWGRIGKCLSRLLKSIGAKVSVAARKASDRAMLQALGFQTVDTDNLGKRLPEYTVVFNTVPYPVFRIEETRSIGCLLVELASKPGFLNDNIIIARGLPGTLAPRSSGKLIADTILHLHKEGLK